MNEENEIFKEIERDAFHNWDSLTNEQKQTKRYVLAALKSSELPRLDYNFIPDSLKGDRDVTLEAFKRKRECAYSYDTHFQKLLTELTYNWRNDRELILALCENRLAPQALSNASDSLKEDEQVVRAVCMHDPNNLEHCGPNIRQKLIADRDFMLSIISEETNGKMLAYASKALRSDRDLVAEALRHGFPYDDIALELKEDRALLREAITKDCTVYMKLPDALKSDSVLAAAAVMCGSSTRTEYEDDELAFDNEYKVVVEDAFKHAPGIFSNRKIMWEAAPSSPFDRRDCWNTTFQHCHESLRNDRELVLRFLKTTRAVYENLNVSLRRDPEVIACAIDGCCSCCSSFITELISFVPRDCLIEHPELAIRAFDRGRGAFFQEFNVRYIPRRLFRRLDVAQAYADNGGKMCTQGFPKDHCDNLDLCLRFLKNDLYPIFLDIRKCYSHVLNWVSENLLRDKSFMVEALNAFSGRMHIHLLLGKFQREVIDYDVRLALFGAALEMYGNSCFIKVLQETEMEDMLPVFAREVKEKLQTCDAFMLFLFGVSIVDQHQTPPALRSRLPMLCKDEDTMKGIGKTIKLYLGVPVGNELKLLRRAWSDPKIREHSTL